MTREDKKERRLAKSETPEQNFKRNQQRALAALETIKKAIMSLEQHRDIGVTSEKSWEFTGDMGSMRYELESLAYRWEHWTESLERMQNDGAVVTK